MAKKVFRYIPEREKDEILGLLEDGKKEEATQLLQEKLTRAKDLVNTLEKTAPEQIDYTTYLTHAPAEARDFFESMTPEHQADAMQHIEYLPNSIIIKDDNGKLIAEMDNKDLTAPEQPGKIETVYGLTYFQRDAMTQYTKENNIQVPTANLREQMLRVMPARDYKKHTRCQAGLQLYRLLGGKLLGYRYGGRANDVGGYGYFWSSSENGTEHAFALVSHGGKGILHYSNRNNLFPVRALRTA